MDPVTAFGLACNVIAVTQTAVSIAKQCNELSKNTGSFEDVLYLTNNINNASSRLQDTLNKANQQPNVGSKDVDLRRLAEDTIEVSEKLIEQIRDSQPRDPTSMRSRAHSKLRSMRNLKPIKALQEQLEKYERAVDTQQLSRLSQQSDEELEMLANGLAGIDLLSLRQNENFTSLQTAFQSVIQRLIDLQSTFKEQTEKSHNAIVNLQTDNEQNRTRKQILESLYLPALAARQASIREPHPSTCTWIFDEDETHDWDNFTEWLSDGQDPYWVSGILGSGKSTLMNFILHDSRTEDHLQSWAGGTKLLMLNFFFWRAGSDEQKTKQGLLRYLVYQILDSDWEHFSAAVKLPRGSHPSWSDITLKQTLRDLIDSQRGKVSFALFVDGLDEAVADDTRDLLDLLTQLCSKSNCKVCASSRPESVFEVHFKDALKLRLEHLNHDDIAKYVNEKLDSDLRMGQFRREDPGECSRLKDDLVERAKGVFIWVYLAVQRMLDVLDQERPLVDLFEAVYLLPERMEEMYRHMLSKISKADYEAASRWFSLVNVVEHTQHADCTELKEINRRQHGFWALGIHNFSILHLLAIGFKQEIISIEFSDISTLRPRIESLVARVSSNTAGLLECSFSACDRGCDYLDLHKSISSKTRLRYDKASADRWRHDNRSQALLEHLLRNTRLQWVHGSARDFLDSDQCDTVLKSRISALHGFSAKALFEAEFQLAKMSFKRSIILTLDFLSLAEQQLGQSQVKAVEALEHEIIRQAPNNVFSHIDLRETANFGPVYLYDSLHSPGTAEGYIADFAGVAINFGLTLYAREKLKTLSGIPALEKATYLLMLLVEGVPNTSMKDVAAMMEYNVDPNAHVGSIKEFKWNTRPSRFSSIWGTYLCRIGGEICEFSIEERLEMFNIVKLFLQAGANVNEDITDWCESGVTTLVSHSDTSYYLTTVRYSPLFFFRQLQSHALRDEVINILERQGAESFCEMIELQYHDDDHGTKFFEFQGEPAKELGLAWAGIWLCDPFQFDEETLMPLLTLLEETCSKGELVVESGESSADVRITHDWPKQFGSESASESPESEGNIMSLGSDGG